MDVKSQVDKKLVSVESLRHKKFLQVHLSENESLEIVLPNGEWISVLPTVVWIAGKRVHDINRRPPDGSKGQDKNKPSTESALESVYHFVIQENGKDRTPCGLERNIYGTNDKQVFISLIPAGSARAEPCAPCLEYVRGL